MLVTARILICWVIHHFFWLNDVRIFGRARRLRSYVSILTGMLLVFYVNQYLKWEAIVSWGNRSDLNDEQVLITNLFRAFIISGASYFVVYYFQVNLQLQRSRLENEYLKQDQLKAQLFSLQQQVSPHFLFNSLSTLRTIAPDKATKTYVSQLANVYRYLLTVNESPVVAVGTELAFMKSYLYILQERFEEGLQVSIRIGEEFLDWRIPPLTLQILVENAIKHNVVAVEQPLLLQIYTCPDGTLTVENCYQPKTSGDEKSGKGLQNISDRYLLLNGGSITVRQTDTAFCVTLPLFEI
jgi:LytS/YehU family sensor histidine kinase